jgi:hypothetical protein
MQCIADKEITPQLESLDIVDQAIQAMLNECQFWSVQDLTKTMFIPSIMI